MLFSVLPLFFFAFCLVRCLFGSDWAEKLPGDRPIRFLQFWRQSHRFSRSLDSFKKGRFLSFLTIQIEKQKKKMEEELKTFVNACIDQQVCQKFFFHLKFFRIFHVGLITNQSLSL